MTPRQLLVNSLALLVRESRIPGMTEYSTELVGAVLERIQPSQVSLGFASDPRDVYQGLKRLILDLCSGLPEDPPDVTLMLEQIKIITGHDQDFYTTIEQVLLDEKTDKELTASTKKLRKSLSNFLNEAEIEKILTSASAEFKFSRDRIKSVPDFLARLSSQLEPYYTGSKSRDKAIISEIMVGTKGAVATAFTNLQQTISHTGVIKTRWQALNRALQGGVRRGEMVVPSAFRHNYKTAGAASVFCDASLLNKPMMFSAKMPLNIYFSFEDDDKLFFKFVYQDLMYGETGKPVKLDGILPETMEDYVTTRLGVNGYYNAFVHIDGTQYTYRDICSKIIEFESLGYEVHFIVLDYLLKVSTEGCVSSGIGGEDLKDLFTRIKNFCNLKKIACFAPHQLSSSAKEDLLRRNVRKEEIVIQAVNKGYFQNCRTLDQVMDVEMYFHIVEHEGLSYLSVCIGKLKGNVLRRKDAYFMLPFPTDEMPIQGDLGRADMSITKLPMKRPGNDQDYLD